MDRYGIDGFGHAVVDLNGVTKPQTPVPGFAGRGARDRRPAASSRSRVESVSGS